MVRTKAEARGSLGPIEPLLAEVVSSAFEDYEHDTPTVRSFLRRGAQATVIHSLMVKHARRLFAGMDGVEIHDDGQLFCLVIRGEWTIKFRMLGAGLHVASTGTQLGMDFAEQVPTPIYGQQMALFSLEGPTYIHVGYRLNKTKTGIASIHVVCPNGERRNHWDYDLDDNAAIGAVPVPIAPKTPTIDPQRGPRRVAPRRVERDTSRVRPAAEKEARREKAEQAVDSDGNDEQTSS